jgi:rod shape-determining protein MreC
MQDVIERSRPTLLLLVVLAVLLLVMSISKQTRYIGETRTMFERTVMTVFSPVPKAVNWVGQSASDMYHGYLDMRRSINENIELHRKVVDLTRENLILRQSQGDLARMRSMVNYTEEVPVATSMAQIIMLDTSARFKSVIINRGSDAGIEVNDPIVNANGLVGRVVLTTKDMAKVQLITDNNSAVGCLLERTRRQGVLHGDGDHGGQLEGIPALADAQPGDVVVTAGIDGIYPKGIPVGTVSKVEEGKGLTKPIWVRPAVDFGSIEEVIVLHTKKIPHDVVRYAP